MKEQKISKKFLPAIGTLRSKEEKNSHLPALKKNEHPLILVIFKFFKYYPKQMAGTWLFRVSKTPRVLRNK